METLRLANSEEQLDALQKGFQLRFGHSARLYQAPGRVNLIGEHTDYNDGFVMPAAIGFFTRVAGAPRSDLKLNIYSENFAQLAEFDLNALPATKQGHWSDYAVGVADTLVQAGISLRGADLLLAGDVPVAAGLSSSASVEVAVCQALLDLSEQKMSPRDMALLCQCAENEFVGARCGVMDQFISVHGVKDHALLLDCRSLDYRLLPLPPEDALVICNTMVKHSVATGEYNQRRAECEAGVSILARHRPEIHALRDATEADLAQAKAEMTDVVARRCRHIIRENDRVLRSGEALEAGDLELFGRLMNESHLSMRDDFEISCAELDTMVEIAQAFPGVLGARMTGGGFGGCTVNLVPLRLVEAFRTHIAAEYQRSTGLDPEIYVCAAADGVRRLL